MPIFAKVNASMPWHDKVAELPSDSVRWAYLKAICAAKQRESGIFSKPALTEALGTHARHIPVLVKARLIDQDGQKYSVHDFDEHQGPIDPGASERKRRQRQRERREHESASSPHVDTPVDNVTVTRDVTEPVTRDTSRLVTRPVTVQSRTEQSKSSTDLARYSPREPEGTTDDVPDESDRADAVDALTDVLVLAGVWRRPSKKMIGFLSNLIRDHGVAMVNTQIAILLQGKPPDEFMTALAENLRASAIARTNGSERSRVEAERRSIEQEQEQIEQLRKEPGAEERAAERRAALQGFADGLGLPSTPKPRSTEGRQAP
jgi:hypothetical protein